MSDEKKTDRPPLRVVNGTARRDRPRSVHLREANKDMAPLNLKREWRHVKDRLGADGAWLWHTLGSHLVRNGLIVCLDADPFFWLCWLYDHRDKPSYKREFFAQLRALCVERRLLEGPRGDANGETVGAKST